MPDELTVARRSHEASRLRQRARRFEELSFEAKDDESRDPLRRQRLQCWLIDRVMELRAEAASLEPHKDRHPMDRHFARAYERLNRPVVMATQARATPARRVRPASRPRSPRSRPTIRRTRAGTSRAGPGSDDPHEPPHLDEGLSRAGDCLGVAELCARTGVSPKRMRIFLADFEAAGIAECVNADDWRLTPTAASYTAAFRAMQVGNVPLEPGDDDGLSHCAPGPQKAAA